MDVLLLIQLFTPDALSDTGGLEKALSYVRGFFTQASSRAAEIQGLLAALISDQCPTTILEYILSNDDVVYKIAYRHLSSPSYQPSAEDASAISSIGLHLLHFFKSALSSNIRIPRELSTAGKSLIHLDIALNALSLVEGSSSQPSRLSSDDRNGFQNRVPQGYRSKGCTTVIQAKQFAEWEDSFQQIGEKVPRTFEELASTRHRLVLKTQQTILPYMNALQLPNIQRYLAFYYRQGLEGQVEDGSSNQTESCPAPSRRACFARARDAGFGDWHIDFSTQALGALSGLDNTIQSMLDKKLRELSHGIFSDTNHIQIAGGGDKLPVYKAKVTSDLRLVYQIECGPVFTASGHLSDFDIQQIRVLGLYNHKQMDRSIWSAVASQSKHRHPEYRRRCTYRAVPRNKSKGLYITPPAVFQRGSNIAEPLASSNVDEHEELTDDDYVKLHEILSLAKFMPYTPSLLQAAQKSENLNYPFKTSERENEVICHPSACLVIGRSGTGKTTTMMFRMLDKEIEAREQGKAIRQVFITQSHFLATRVEEYFRSLSGSCSLPRSVYVSEKDAVGLHLDDDDIDKAHNLPQRFSELNKTHFPMFITFDQLRTLLERDLDDSAADLSSRLGHRATESLPYFYAKSPLGAAESEQTNFVSYDFFLCSMWPRFDERLTRNLDSALVFNEFMGVIMGSEASLETPKGFLDYDAYIQLSSRTQGTFASSRELIYELFERYLKMRTQRKAIDSPQRTHAILNKVKNGFKLAPKFDHLYVDEAQDNTIVDVQLLRLLSNNPHGQVWSGDTAQTIAAGSSFRFDDLKAFLYRAERKEPLVVCCKRKPIQPKLFHLPINYRSHAGIVNVAASVIHIISKLFPKSIDSMDVERGLVHDGPKPEYVNGSEGISSFKKFLSLTEDDDLSWPPEDDGDRWHSGSADDTLGADQAILVRNDRSREYLINCLGKSPGLVFTIYDSKGLEFNDVILYDFFADSEPSETEWRSAIRILDSGPSFEDDFGSRVASIQTELKCLYVAITRTRKRLWIWESSKKGNSLRDWWCRGQKLVTLTKGPDTEGSEPSTFTRHESSESEWLRRGVDLFNNQKFKDAAMCFVKAKRAQERDISEAFETRRIARSLPIGSQNRMVVMNRVSTAFQHCGDNCNYEGRKRKLHARSAEAFLECKEFSRAGHQFYLAKNYKDAAIAYRHGGRFDKAVAIVQNHRAEIPPRVVDAIIDSARIYFARTSLLDECRTLFDNEAQLLDFLTDLGLHDQQLKLLERSSRPRRLEEMAKIHFTKGEKHTGIKYLLMSQNWQSHQEASKILWNSIWDEFPLGVAHSRSSLRRIQELLDLQENAPTTISQANHLALIKQLTGGDKIPLLQIGLGLFEQNDSKAAFLAFDAALQGLEEIFPPAATLESASKVLRCFSIYAGLVHRTASDRSCMDDRWYQSMFGLVPEVEGPISPNRASLKVSPNSIFFSAFKPRSSNPGYTPESTPLKPTLVRLKALKECMADTLHKRLNSFIWRLHEHAMRLKGLRVCSSYLMLGKCLPASRGCGIHEPDAQKSGLNEATFSLRVRVHLQLVIALNHLVVSRGQWNDFRRDAQRVWLERLFETLHPAAPGLGSILNIRSDLIPEFEEGMSLVRAWTQERFLKLAPPHPNQLPPWSFLTEILVVSSLAFQLDPRNASRYLRQGHWSFYSTSNSLLVRIPRADGTRVLRPTVERIFRWLSQVSVGSLAGCTYFLRDVIEKNLDVDLNILVHFIEMIVGHVIITTRSFSDGQLEIRRSLSGVLLPRSWLYTAMAHRPGIVTRHNALNLISTLGHLIGCLALNSSPARILVGAPPSSHRRADVLERNISMSRMCRCVVFLGHNLGEEWRTIVMNTLNFRDLFKNDELDRLHPTLLRPYVHASRNRTWGEVIRTAAYVQNPSLDELIFVYTGTQQPPPKLSLVATALHFSTRESFIAKLRQAAHGERPTTQIPTRLVLQVRMNTNPHRVVTKGDVKDIMDPLPLKGNFVKAETTGVPAEQDTDKGGDGHNKNMDERGSGVSPNQAEGENFASEYTDRHHIACTLIQRSFRRYLRKQGAVNYDDSMVEQESEGLRNPTQEVSEEDFAFKYTDRHRVACIRIQRAFRRQLRKRGATKSPGYYEAYLAASLKNKHSFTPRYGLRFLGPVPHILDFLERISARATKKKLKINTSLRTKDHSHFEVLWDERKLLTRIITDAQELFNTFHPDSVLHIACTIKTLKSAIEQVVSLKESSECVIGSLSVDEDYLFGVEALVRDLSRSRTRKQRKRPVLNVSDV